VAMAREGQDFIKHEFDEAIAIQQSIVECERQLAEVHPMEATRSELQKMLKTDEKALSQLEQLGGQYGATGEREEVAQHMEELGAEVAGNAKNGPDSEKYEMHAVVLTMKRKQQDSATAMAEIAKKIGDTKMQEAATRFQKDTREAADQLARSLTHLAVDLASRGRAPLSR